MDEDEEFSYENGDEELEVESHDLDDDETTSEEELYDSNEEDVSIKTNYDDDDIPEGSYENRGYRQLLSKGNREPNFTGHNSLKCNLCSCTMFNPVKSGSKMCVCGHDDYHHEWKD